MQRACPNCGAFMAIEKIFCIRCGERVVQLTKHDLEALDFVYPPDRDAMESLKNFEALSPLFDELIVKHHIRSALSRLEECSSKIDFSSKLGSIVRECGVILGLSRLPKAYLLESDAPTAFTFGMKDQYFLVISFGLLGILDEGEVKAAIGHECGHIKCHHIKYHTIAELLLRGAEFSLEFMGGLLNVISPVLRLMLFSWHRESEISADRAALIVSDDPAKPISLLKKLAKNAPVSENPAFEPLSTHPVYKERISHILNYYRSPEYRAVREKVGWRLAISKALAPFCRFCGGAKPVAGLFCPRCGRSQV